MAPVAKLPLQRPLVSRLCQFGTKRDRLPEVRILTREVTQSCAATVPAFLRAIGSRSVAETAESGSGYWGGR